MPLTDEELVSQFETKTLCVDELSHSSHLRITWLYLKKFDLKTAIEKTGTGTKEFAESLGITDKYHQTITEAIVRIMDTRMDKLQTDDFTEFLQHNDDLVHDLISVLGDYYTEEILQSSDARFKFLPPDKRNFV